MIFTVNKGEHYFLPQPFSLTTKASVRFNFSLKGQFPYTLSSNQSQINKLHGLADGLDNTAHSVWLGWRNDGITTDIELFIYCHNGEGNPQMGGRNIWFQSVGFIKPYELAECNLGIDRKRGQYYLEYKVVKVTIKRTKKGRTWINRKLYPYFGGSIQAPSQFKIEIL